MAPEEEWTWFRQTGIEAASRRDMKPAFSREMDAGSNLRGWAGRNSQQNPDRCGGDADEGAAGTEAGET
jgi:hypothetical protein